MISKFRRLEFIRVRSYVNDRSSDQLEIIGLSDFKSIEWKTFANYRRYYRYGRDNGHIIKKELEKFQPKTIHVVSLFTKRRKGV